MTTLSTGADADTNGEDDDTEEATAMKVKAVRADEEVSSTRVEAIVRALKDRLRSRVALQKQLDALVKVGMQNRLKKSFLNYCTG